MMDCFSFVGIDGMGWMMGGMALFWISILLVLVLGFAALVKYLRADRAGEEVVP